MQRRAVHFFAAETVTETSWFFSRMEMSEEVLAAKFPVSINEVKIRGSYACRKALTGYPCLGARTLMGPVHPQPSWYGHFICRQQSIFMEP